MSRETKSSDLAELRRSSGDYYSDSEFEEASDGDCYGSSNDDRYDIGGFSARGGCAGAFNNDFGQPRMPLSQGHAMMRPFEPREDFGCERGGAPSHGCGPRLDSGCAPFRPTARTGWSQSPQCNRSGPPSHRRPFFRDCVSQAERPSRYLYTWGGFGGTRGRGFGDRSPFRGNYGTSSRDHDYARYNDCREEDVGVPPCQLDGNRQDRPQWRQRGRSVTPPTRLDTWSENWKTRLAQGPRKSDDRGSWSEPRSFYFRSGSSDSETDRGRRHSSRDSDIETTMSRPCSRAHSQNVTAEGSHPVAARITSESRELARESKTATRFSSRARTDYPREEEYRSKRPGYPLFLGARFHHNETDMISAKPTVCGVLDNPEPASKATTREAKNEGEMINAVYKTGASSCRPSTAKRPALDNGELTAKKKLAKNAELMITDNSCFSPISEDSSDLGDTNATELEADTAERHSEVDVQYNDVEDPMDAAIRVLTVVETNEGPESSEEAVFPEVEIEEVVPAQDDDANAEESCEMPDPAACVEFIETLRCEPEQDTAHHSGSSSDTKTSTFCESRNAPLADGEQDAASVVNCTSPYSTSSISWDEDSTSVTEEGSRASKTASESSASATKSQSESPSSPAKSQYCREASSRINNDPENAHSETSSATPEDWDQDTASFAPSNSDDVAAVLVPEGVSVASADCWFLDRPGPSTKPSHSAQRSTRQEQLQRAATSLTEAGPSRDTGTTPETHSRGSSTEDVLFELDAFMAMSVHELLEDEAAKKQTLAWYVTGRRTNTKRACAEEIRKLLVAAARSERAKRRHLSSALRRIVQFQSSLSRLSPDTSPMSQEREKLDDDTDP
ncbi:hypothetical protein MRX96_023753 [Rhipicephalus microplus]